MKNPVQPTKAINPVRNSISRPPLRHGFLLIPLALALAWLALSPTAQAVDPAPDGGYPGSNTAEGTDALFSLDTSLGVGNTAIGFDALYFNTTGVDNTATGVEALYSNTTGIYNTATGVDALFTNTTGDYNTANGIAALFSNTTGFNNTASGVDALFSNTTGFSNTANGIYALFSNTTGNFNTANGVQALYYNTTGNSNTANGVEALEGNTTGNYNTASGQGALFSNTIGRNNTAEGENALRSNTTGINNTADGGQALFNNTTGSQNVALGYQAGINLTTGNNNIDIGNVGITSDSGKIRIGKVGTQNATFIAGISGVTVAGGVGVIIDTNGNLGTIVSSERFKDAIKPMDKASEAILALKPVTFRYKHELDPKNIPQFGLVAEEVEKVNPDLVARDDQGKAYTVRYEAVNAMLLNEFLKEHRKVEEHEATISQLKSAVAREETVAAQQQKQIMVLTATIQNVSDKVEMSKAAPQMVANNQ